MNIYVGNLSYNTTEENLKEVFESYGEVKSVSIIKDKFSGKSRGFGFVEMPNDAEGKSAIEALNEREFDGRNLKINEAKPKENRRDRDRRPRRRDNG